MKIIFAFVLFITSVHAQVPEDLRLRGSMKNLPISLGIDPQFQFQRKNSRTFYSAPVRMARPSLLEASDKSGWWEVTTDTRAKGLGIKLPLDFRPGLAVYKGSNQKTLKQVASRAPAGSAALLPKELDELGAWKEGDSGDFETYGGVLARLKFRLPAAASITAVVGLQNSFTVSLKKKKKEIELTISEGKLTERAIKAGVEIIKIGFARMKNKTLSFRFLLDPALPLHQDLYRSALKGDIAKLQSELRPEKQTLRWTAKERKISVGTSLLRKETWTWTDLSFPGTTDAVYLRTKVSKGKIGQKRSWKDYVLLEEKGITLHWTHQMKKMTDKRFRKFFLRRLFDMNIDYGNLYRSENVKFGKVLTEIAVHLDRETIERIDPLALPEEIRGRPWMTVRRKLGIFFLNHPEILPGLFPGRKAHVKFWSTKLQSFEGEFSLGPALPEARSRI